MLISQHPQQGESISTSLFSSDYQVVNLTKKHKQKHCYEQKIKNFKQTTNQQLTQVQFMIKPLHTENFQIEIYRGLQITCDGVVRYFLSIYSFCFGFNQYDSFQIEDLQDNCGLINIKQYGKENLILSGSQYALQFLDLIPNIQHQLAKEVLGICEYNAEKLKNYFSKQEASEFLYQQKEEEFQRFQQMCMLFLQQLYKQNSNQMFTYQIVRLSKKYNGIDLQNYGFSKSYLDLLGIDSQTLSQIILRGKQIDLLPKKSDISNQSLSSLSNMKKEERDSHTTEITTFDGFVVRLYFQTKNYGKLFPNPEVLEGGREYYFLITEIDIDINDLNQLIFYRQRIVGQSKLSYEDFIKKELSYQFEDVEYSIHSQVFLEKYYNLNIQNLQQQQQQQQSGFRVIQN